MSKETKNTSDYTNNLKRPRTRAMTKKAQEQNVPTDASQSSNLQKKRKQSNQLLLPLVPPSLPSVVIESTSQPSISSSSSSTMLSKSTDTTMQSAKKPKKSAADTTLASKGSKKSTPSRSSPTTPAIPSKTPVRKPKQKTTPAPSIGSTASSLSTPPVATLSGTIPDYSRELKKILQTMQTNTIKIDTILENQASHEAILKEQGTQLLNLSSKLEQITGTETSEAKRKQKGKNVERNDFYQDAIKKLSYELFHEHKQISDHEMKNRLKEKLEKDEYCANQLQKLSEKNISYDDLWDNRMYSALLSANRMKKGYYIKKLKEALWSTFGIKRIRPFKDSFSKEQMREWKASEDVKKVHDDLYEPCDAEDPSSKTYLTLIYQAVFPQKERTKENATWTQSVLEAIFDEDFLETKIDVDIVETWTKRALSDVDMNDDETDDEADDKEADDKDDGVDNVEKEDDVEEEDTGEHDAGTNVEEYADYYEDYDPMEDY